LKRGPIKDDKEDADKDPRTDRVKKRVDWINVIVED
jgi:hypothetical protein